MKKFIIICLTLLLCACKIEATPPHHYRNLERLCANDGGMISGYYWNNGASRYEYRANCANGASRHAAVAPSSLDFDK